MAALDLKKFGKNAKELRESLNLEPAAASKKASSNGGSISAQRIASIEKGGDPTLSEIHALAVAYAYTPGGLVSRCTK